MKLTKSKPDCLAENVLLHRIILFITCRRHISNSIEKSPPVFIKASLAGD
jgi:hypothetical protein